MEDDNSLSVTPAVDLTEQETNITQEQRTNREISNANLVPIKPGEALNPGGRPKGESITAQLRSMLNEKDKDGKSNAEKIAELLIREAQKPNSRHLAALIKEILDRTEGKVLDTHKIEGDIPVTINYILKERADA